MTCAVCVSALTNLHAVDYPEYPSFLVPHALELANEQRSPLPTGKVVRRVVSGDAQFVESVYSDKLASECLQGREPRMVNVYDRQGKRFDHSEKYETLIRADFPIPGAVVTRSEGVCTHGPAFGSYVYLTDKSGVYRFSWPLSPEQAMCGEDYQPAIEIRYEKRSGRLLMFREERPDCKFYSAVPAIAAVEYLVVEAGEKLVLRRYAEAGLPSELRAKWQAMKTYRTATR